MQLLKLRVNVEAGLAGVLQAGVPGTRSGTHQVPHSYLLGPSLLSAR